MKYSFEGRKRLMTFQTIILNKRVILTHFSYLPAQTQDRPTEFSLMEIEKQILRDLQRNPNICDSVIFSLKRKSSHGTEV
jgi:hypothetical protein